MPIQKENQNGQLSQSILKRSCLLLPQIPLWDNSRWIWTVRGQIQIFSTFPEKNLFEYHSKKTIC